jgi:hypothetical protein
MQMLILLVRGHSLQKVPHPGVFNIEFFKNVKPQITISEHKEQFWVLFTKPA